jgi:hypothetical protein
MEMLFPWDERKMLYCGHAVYLYGGGSDLERSMFDDGQERIQMGRSERIVAGSVRASGEVDLRWERDALWDPFGLVAGAVDPDQEMEGFELSRV